MAGKFVVGHDHCKTCGTCFIAGVTKDIHKCPQAVRPDVLAVMWDEMRSTDEKTRIRNRVYSEQDVSSS